MATDNESFNRDLYDLLKVRGYNPVPLNSQNQRVKASQEADVIQFEFNKDGESYGTAWVTVDDAQNIIVYYDQEQQDSPSTSTPGVEYDDSWTGFLKHLKNWAQRRQMSFELANKDRLGDDMRQREYYKMKEKLGESYHPMGKKASYNDAVPNVKIVLQHNRSLEEGEARFRNVARIYLENVDGERFLAPTTRPGIARVYARHIAEGGLPNDEKWNHIKSICEDYNKMAGFVRATRNGQFNESAQQLVQEGINHYTSLRETLHKLTTHKGYHNYFESYTPALMEDEGEDLSEMFMSSSMDPRIEAAMPILSRLQKPINEMSEVDSLSEWADSIISEKLELEENKFTVSAPPKHSPTEIEAKTRDEAVELAAKKWRVPTEEITVHGGKSTTQPTTQPEQPEPDDGSALSRAEKKAKTKTNPLSKFDIDDVMAIGKLGLGVSEGEVIKFPKGWVDASDEGEDEMDWDDESWIPSEEEFEREEELRNRKHKPANDLEEMEKDLYQGRRYDPRKGPQGPDKTAKAIPMKKAVKDAEKMINKAFKGEVEENFIGMAPQAVAEEEVEEGLDANQKRVGQLGPTEKVKNNNIGKLVGASESKELDPELARIIEMARFKR